MLPPYERRRHKILWILIEKSKQSSYLFWFECILIFFLSLLYLSRWNSVEKFLYKISNVNISIDNIRFPYFMLFDLWYIMQKSYLFYKFLCIFRNYCYSLFKKTKICHWTELFDFEFLNQINYLTIIRILRRQRTVQQSSWVVWMSELKSVRLGVVTCIWIEMSAGKGKYWTPFHRFKVKLQRYIRRLTLR